MEVKILDRTRFIDGVKELLEINPKTTALVAIDMHQGHLDPEVASMLVPEEERKRVLTQAPRLIEIARKYQIPTIHVIFQLRPIENDTGVQSLRQTCPLGQRETETGREELGGQTQA